MADPDEHASKSLQWVSIAGVVATLFTSIFAAVLSQHTSSVVEKSQHAQEFSSAFEGDMKNITSFVKSAQRSDEQEADMSMTALYDFAQSPEDKMAMLTIAARMLNSTDCPGSGEATARFLTVIIQQLKAENTADDRRLLRFVRLRSFMDLASDDVTTVYFNDDFPDDSNFPKTCGSTTAAAQLRPPAGASPPARAKLFTPSIGSLRNHATYWGERSPWNDPRNELFRELRADDYTGWIHVATWETADACVDATGKTIARCTGIRIHYTSTPFAYAIDAPTNLTTPFWLGRARFLRDAPPHVYEHASDEAMHVRGTLGRVTGVVDYGECVAPIGRPVYVPVSAQDEPRSFVHVWVNVRAAPKSACWPTDGR